LYILGSALIKILLIRYFFLFPEPLSLVLILHSDYLVCTWVVYFCTKFCVCIFSLSREVFFRNNLSSTFQQGQIYTDSYCYPEHDWNESQLNHLGKSNGRRVLCYPPDSDDHYHTMARPVRKTHHDIYLMYVITKL